MKLILYSGIKEKRGRQLGRLIRERLPDLQVKASKSLWDLEQGVCRLLNGISVIVARVFSENELTRLLKLKKISITIN